MPKLFICHTSSRQTLSSLQVKYKEDVQKELSSSLFCSLPQTLQTELAKEVTELQSQVTTSRRFRSPVLMLLTHGSFISLKNTSVM